MTETNERVTVDFDKQSYYLDGEYWESWDNYGEEMADKINQLLNELYEENQFLKEKEKDMLDYLKNEYDYVYKQKIKHLDDAVLVTCYEMIEYHIRSMIEHLERI